jgi:hypothetical protein
MVKRSNSKCIIESCNSIAIFGRNLTPYYCDIHKKEDDVNLSERTCVSCSLEMILGDDGKCEFCNPQMYEYKLLGKQTALFNYLDSVGLAGNYSDKIVDSSCGKERPDRVFDLTDKIIILECDEHQHKHYNIECERIRMINLGQMYGGTPVYFIRFNPDYYISDKKDEEFNISKRYEYLKCLLNDIINCKMTLPTSLVSVIYLFYDNWKLGESSWHILQSYYDENIIQHV